MGTVIKKQKNRPAIRANMTSSPAKDGQPEADFDRSDPEVWKAN